MSEPQQQINVGQVANDGTGESLRDAFNAVNNNFANVWAAGPVDTQVVITNNRISTNETNLDLVLAGNGIGNVTVASTTVPSIDAVYDLGRANRRWDEVHAVYYYGNGAYLTGITGNGGGGPNVYFSQGAPDDASIGDIWIESDTGVQYLYFNDDTSNQWAEMEAYQSFSSSSTYGNANVVANLAALGSNPVSTTGNITAGYFLGNGSQLTGLPATYGNANVVANLAALGSNPVSSTGNVSAGNVLTSAQVIANGEIQSGTGFSTGGYLSVNGTADLHDTTVTGNLSATGNITATNLGNISAINLTGSNSNVLYGNGVFAAVAGVANTGNVTFDNQVVIGTGDGSSGSGGLYLAPGLGSTANLQYLRVRGGDVASHIHLDTGNSAYFDLYIGDDSRSVKIANTGNIDINTNDGSGNSAQWTFGTDGNLTLPAGDIITDSVETVIISGAGTAAANQTYELTESGQYFGQTDSDYFIDPPEAPSTTYKLRIPEDAGGLYESEDLVTWTIVAGAGGGDAPAPTGVIVPRHIALTVDTNSWVFGVDGILTFPGGDFSITANGSYKGIQAEADVNINIVTFGTGNIALGSLYDAPNVGPPSVASVTVNHDGAGSIQIATGEAASIYWNFGTDGTTTFPTANVDLHNGGVQSGQVLQFGNPNLQSIITGPTPSANNAAERLIIQGQHGNGTGDGGDVYVWGGDADTNGGDIKIYAGDADNVSTGSGGYVNLAGGDGFDNGGAINIDGGSSANGTGGTVSIDGGYGQTDGGTASFQGGYGATGQGGTVQITGGGSGNGTGSFGNVVLGSGSSGWIFDNTGNLTLPNGAIIKDTVTAAVAFGDGAGANTQGAYSVAVGSGAGANTQGAYAVAVGSDAGANTQSDLAVAIGYIAGANTQGLQAVAVGAGAGQNTQGTNAIAIGYSAGNDTQGEASIAIGQTAGNTTQGNSAIAIGQYAGQTNQGNEAVAIGDSAGQTGQHEDAVAIGQNAGQTGQGISSVAIGYGAGFTDQGNQSVAIGENAGANQGSTAVAIGQNAGGGVALQGDDAVAIGHSAGEEDQGTQAIAFGLYAGQTTQGIRAVAIGKEAGQTSQGFNSIAIGGGAGGNTQGNASIAIGADAGHGTQGANAIAIGFKAGDGAQGDESIAIGKQAGYTNQANNSIILNATGSALEQTVANTFTVAPVRNDVANVSSVMFYNTTSKEITYGNVINVAGNVTAGNISTGKITLTNGAVLKDTAGDAVAFGENAGATNQGLYAVAIGETAGNTSQGLYGVAVGQEAGSNTQGYGAVAVGSSAGYDTQGTQAVAIGIYAGYITQSANAVAVGQMAGHTSQGTQSVAIGNESGKTSQGTQSVAVGPDAGRTSQGDYSVAVGLSAGYTTQGIYSVAVGFQSGFTGQGNSAVAIGPMAGFTNQANNSIILNATGSALNQTTANTFTVAPIRNDVANTGQVVFYNTSSKEITYGNTISVAGNVTGNYFIGNGSQLSSVATQVTGSWTLAAGTNTVSLTVPGPGTYSIWVNGNIPNGIVTYTATVVVTNTNVPVVGTSYGWYYAAGNALVLTAIPTQIVGSPNSISTAVVATTTANVFTFGITNNSGSSQVVDYGYTKL